jgi:hypothetical protein
MTSKPPAPRAPAPRATASPSTPTTPPADLTISKGIEQAAHRVVVYGPGGIGKTTLVASKPGRTLFVDLEGGSRNMDVERIHVQDFASVRRILTDAAITQPYDTVVVDTVTALEEVAKAHMLRTVPHEKGHMVNSIEGYGFGKGYQHLFDLVMLVVADLDRLCRSGKDVVLIAHDCVDNVPNPSGEDFIRYEPHIYTSKSGKASIRNRIVQWADHVLYLGYDVNSKNGKAVGGGTRTIWAHERPDHLAKTRTITEPNIPWNDPTDTTIWSLIAQ